MSGRPARVCTFYAQGKNCRFGDKCRFLHEKGSNTLSSDDKGSRTRQGGGGGYARSLAWDGQFHDESSIRGWVRKQTSEEPLTALLSIAKFPTPLLNLLKDPTLSDQHLIPLLSLMSQTDFQDSLVQNAVVALYQEFTAHYQVIENLKKRLSKTLDDIYSRRPAVVQRANTLARDILSLLMKTVEVSPAEIASAVVTERDVAPFTSADDCIDIDVRNLATRLLEESLEISTAQGREETLSFRHIPIIPTTREIASESVNHLHSMVLTDRYHHRADYLDVHFRLLREDCLRPVRKAVHALRKGETPERGSVRSYHNVYVRDGFAQGTSGFVYRLSIDSATCRDNPSTWLKSKVLKYGTLVCLTRQWGEPMVWATVLSKELVRETQPVLDIQVPAGFEPELIPGTPFVLVESMVSYYEAYRPVLQALQQVHHRLPFEGILLGQSTQLNIPRYLRSHGDGSVATHHVSKQHQRLPSGGVWPKIKDDPEALLDESQWQALQLILTKEISVIQGPPGTGKTYVSVQAMKCLLHDAQRRPERKPILVLCYTNHALDQFLEGILPFEQNVVRVGGRSKSEQLASFNLAELLTQRQPSHAESSHKGKLFGLLYGAADGDQRDSLSGHVDDLVYRLMAPMPRLYDLERYMSPSQADALRRDARNADQAEDAWGEWSQGLNWADSSSDDDHSAMRSSQPNVLPVFDDEGEDEDTPLEKLLASRRKALQFLTDSMPPRPPPSSSWSADPAPAGTEASKSAWDSDDDDDWAEPLPSTPHKYTDLKRRMEDELYLFDEEQARASSAILDCDLMRSQAQDVLGVNDVWTLDAADRVRLLRYWIARYRADLCSRVIPLVNEINNLCEELRQLKAVGELSIMKSAAIVGMTTTAAAQKHEVLMRLGADIVMVEEAAEVLESHIVSALSPSTCHLILVGDHLQLRPATAVHDLRIRFQLDVSLFERFVNSGLPIVTLQTQRRMRPEFSKLLRPVYGDALLDADVTLNRPLAHGMSVPLFFLDHTVPEDERTQSLSHSNKHEAEFCVAMARYLVQQGNSPDNIIILTFYKRQVHVIREFLSHGTRNNKSAAVTSIRCTTIDKFQGKEADIVILSCVRSSLKGQNVGIGHTATRNRITVAISRAKIGLYCIGNVASLRAGSKLWRQVLDVVGPAAIGKAMPLSGPDITVSNANEFPSKNK